MRSTGYFIRNCLLAVPLLVLWPQASLAQTPRRRAVNAGLSWSTKICDVLAGCSSFAAPLAAAAKYLPYH